jgi:hypothetical protein
MNVKQWLVVISFTAVSGSVFAQQTEFVAPDANFKPTKLRAAVAEEVRGSILSQQSEFVAPDAGFKPNKSRASVAVEVKQAYAQGDLIPNDAFSTSAAKANSGLALSKAAVISDIQQ